MPVHRQYLLAACAHNDLASCPRRDIAVAAHRVHLLFGQRLQKFRNYLTGARLTTGEIPDASGESEGCLKTSANLTQQNLIFFDVDGITAGGADPLSENPNYRADVLNATILADGTVRDTININTLPTV